MAAHSGSLPIIASVQPDQPLGSWPAWLREIARSINLLSGWVNRPVLSGTLFAALPVAPEAGSLAYITDSNTAVGGAVIAGGGINKVLAWHNGTAWKVIAN